jgi:hypothetical protein
MTIINTILEFIVAVLPLPILFGLKMSKRHRWSVIGILCLGLLVFVVGCVRCWYIYHGYVKTWDSSWGAGPQWTVNEVENNLALVF